MKPKRVSITLSEDEWEGLYQVAQQDVRGVKDQVRYFLRESLKKRGLLQEKPEQAPDTS